MNPISLMTDAELADEIQAHKDILQNVPDLDQDTRIDLKITLKEMRDELARRKANKGDKQ